MATASPANNHGNGSGNANRILSPTLNYKSNNKPEDPGLKTWLLRGAAVGTGVAAGVVMVKAVTNWWWSEAVEEEEHQPEKKQEKQTVLS